MEIKTSSKSVLDSGCISSFNMESVEFVISDDPIMKVEIIISGEMNETETVIKSSAANDQKKLLIEVKNPHVRLNFGPAEPMRIGRIDGKELYLSFRVDIMGKYDSYLLNYTFFLGD